MSVAANVAEGTSVARPLRLAQIVHALRDSGGADVALPEDDIVRTLRNLCAHGLFVEPASATAAATFTSLTASGTIASSETTVVLLTGSGLNAATKVAELIESN